MRRLCLLVSFFILAASMCGCYVHTPVETRGVQYLPGKGYHSIGVIFKDNTGKASKHIKDFKVTVYKELKSKGFVVKFLDQEAGTINTAKTFTENGAREPDLILEIHIVKFGSQEQLVETPATRTIMSTNTSDSQDHIISQPWDKDSSEYCESEYKTVILEGYLTDIRRRRRVWSARAEAKPRVIGCSFLYKSYNKSLSLVQMGQKALREMLANFPRR